MGNSSNHWCNKKNIKTFNYVCGLIVKDVRSIHLTVIQPRVLQPQVVQSRVRPTQMLGPSAPHNRSIFISHISIYIYIYMKCISVNLYFKQLSCGVSFWFTDFNFFINNPVVISFWDCINLHVGTHLVHWGCDSNWCTDTGGAAVCHYDDLPLRQTSMLLVVMRLSLRQNTLFLLSNAKFINKM